MTDDDFSKVLKHGTIDQYGPAMVAVLVARGCKRAGLAKLVSALMHATFDQGADAAVINSPGPEAQVCGIEKH